MYERAETPEEKRIIVNRLLTAWEQLPTQRLSQLIWNATRGRDIFNLEDFDLIREIEGYVDDYHSGR